MLVHCYIRGALVAHPQGVADHPGEIYRLAIEHLPLPLGALELHLLLPDISRNALILFGTVLVAYDACTRGAFSWLSLQYWDWAESHSQSLVTSERVWDSAMADLH